MTKKVAMQGSLGSCGGDRRRMMWRRLGIISGSDGVKKDDGGVEEDNDGVCGDDEGFAGVGSVVGYDKGIDDNTTREQRQDMVVRVYHNSVHMRLIQQLKDVVHGEPIKKVVHHRSCHTYEEGSIYTKSNSFRVTFHPHHLFFKI